MANKTVQALKISATLSLNQDARVAAHHVLFTEGEARRTAATSVKIKISHAVVARYDDPEYSARVTGRIAAIKAALAERGELEDWRVVAGAVAVEEAEVLPNPEPEVGPETVTGDGAGEVEPPADDTEKAGGPLLREASGAKGTGAPARAPKGSKPPAFA